MVAHISSNIIRVIFFRRCLPSEWKVVRGQISLRIDLMNPSQGSQQGNKNDTLCMSNTRPLINWLVVHSWMVFDLKDLLLHQHTSERTRDAFRAHLILALRPHLDMVWAAFFHILWAGCTWMLPWPHWRTAYTTDITVGVGTYRLTTANCSCS